MSSQQTSQLNIVMGAMTFGQEGSEGARVHDLKQVEAILDIFQKHGHTEVDTARTYADGTSEEYLGLINSEKRGLRVGTKLYANAVNPAWTVSANAPARITHSAEDLRKHLDISLKALKISSLEIYYLHAPDRMTPFEITFKALDELHKEGKFKRLGISNFMSWEVAEVVLLCRSKGYIQPTVYQGIYNAVHRKVEPELFPCLRKFGLSFYAYNPLGGGFFTGRYNPDSFEETGTGSRFDPTRQQGQFYRKRYWNDHYFGALAHVQTVSEQHGLTMAEVALRWLSHHSLLKRALEDAIIIGASSVRHIEQNLLDLEKGPLPDEVVQALDHAWDGVKGHATNYWF